MKEKTKIRIVDYATVLGLALPFLYTFIQAQVEWNVRASQGSKLIYAIFMWPGHLILPLARVFGSSGLLYFITPALVYGLIFRFIASLLLRIRSTQQKHTPDGIRQPGDGSSKASP